MCHVCVYVSCVRVSCVCTYKLYTLLDFNITVKVNTMYHDSWRKCTVIFFFKASGSEITPTRAKFTYSYIIIIIYYITMQNNGGGNISRTVNYNILIKTCVEVYICMYTLLAITGYYS